MAFFRLRRQPRHEPIAPLEGPGQLRELDARKIEHLVESLQGEVLAREHALDARLAHAQGARHAGVGRALRLELALERVDQCCACAHVLASCRAKSITWRYPRSKPAIPCAWRFARAEIIPNMKRAAGAFAPGCNDRVLGGESGGMRPQHRPEGPDTEGRRKSVELDLVIGAPQTLAVQSSRLRGVSRDPQDGRIADFSRAGIARTRTRPLEGTHRARGRLRFSQNTIL